MKKFLVSAACVFVLLGFSNLAFSANTVKIGVLAPLSGTYAHLGEHETWAIKGAVEEINAKGGIKGSKIELVIYDDEANPTVAVRKATELFTKDNVDFLVATVHSGATIAVSTVAAKFNKIHMVCIAEAAAITEENCVRTTFRASGNARIQANALGGWMVKNLGKKYYFIGADYAMGRSGVETMKQVILDNGGESLGEVFAPLGTQDFAPYLGKIQAAKPEVLFMTVAGNDVIRLVKQLDEFGLKKQMKVTGSPQMIETGVLPAMGESATGLISTCQYVYNIDRPQNKKFIEIFVKYSGGEMPNQYSNSSYESIYLLAMGAEKAKSLKAEDMIPALEGLQYDAPQGFTTLRPSDHQSVRDMYILEISSGKYKILDTRKGEEVIGPNKCNKW